MFLLLNFIAILSVGSTCDFFITPTSIFSEGITLEIGSTCSNCGLLLHKCYPNIHIRFYSEMKITTDPLVNWTQASSSSDCKKLGVMPLAAHLPVVQDVELSVLPQSCSPEYRDTHFRVNALLFQTITTETPVPLSSLSSTPAPVLQSASRIGLYPLPTGGREFLLPRSSQNSGSLVVKFGELKGEMSGCTSTSSPTLYSLSPSTLLHLDSGAIHLISGSSVTHIPLPECAARLVIPSDLLPDFSGERVTSSAIAREFFVITETKTENGVISNSIYKVGVDMTVVKFLSTDDLVLVADEDTFTCLGGNANNGISVTSFKFLDLQIIAALAKFLVLLSYETAGAPDPTYLYLTGEGSTGTCSRFPGSIHNVVLPSKIGPGTSGGVAGIALKIDRVFSIQESSPHVIATGSAVLYSPCTGCVWYILPVELSPGNNYKFTTDHAGRYLVESPNALYYGTFGSVISLSSNLKDYQKADVLALQDDIVLQLFFSDSSGTVAQSERIIDLGEITRGISERESVRASLKGLEKKGVRVRVCGSHDPTITRMSPFTYHQPSRFEDGCYEGLLPEQVHLQFGESYSILIQFSLLHPSSHSDIDYLVRESGISVNVGNSSLVGVEVDKVVDYELLTVLYTVTLRDSESATLARPGEHLKAVSVSLFPQHSSPYTLHILLGCKPGQEIMLCREYTSNLLEMTTHNVTHVHYDFPFSPTFLVTDKVTGISEPCLQKFNLTIVGGGNTIENIKLFPEEDIAKINTEGGSMSVWSWNDDHTKAKWLCRERSPCNDEYPELGQGVPVYCFKLQLTNNNNDNTYCSHKEELTVCLHGIPLSVWQSLVALVLFVLIAIFIAILYFVRLHGWSNLLEELGLRKEQEEDMEEEHARFIAQQNMTGIRPKHHSIRGDRRSSILMDIRTLQGGTLASRGSLRMSSTAE